MLLYHYCPVPAFLSIIERGEIWVSSLLGANDSLEGKWVVRVLQELRREDSTVSPSIGSLFDRVMGLVEISIAVRQGLAFCLSESRDILSQWRAYADDGRGFCIGFPAEIFDWDMNIFEKGYGESWYHLKQVEYEPSKQKAALLSAYRNIVQTLSMRFGDLQTEMPDWQEYATRIDDLTQEEWKQVHYHFPMFGLGMTGGLDPLPTVYQFKNPSFAEEREWRLLSYIDLVCRDADFRPRSAAVVPFRKVRMRDMSTLPIAEVIIGPRNDTSIMVVRHLLDSFGFPKVLISRSSASYR